ncbi:MAG TPA: SHD1 domain-containing protein [Thermoguttaceae bacterium]|nr:SHD1 domain-containing protein [Thermoguttaceae bacterium]
MSPFRTWKDSSGTYETTAAVEKIEGDKVFLRLRDRDATVQVPLNRLSPADQAYLKDLVGTGEKATEARPNDLAAVTVVLRRDFGNVRTSTDVGILIFADERFGYLQSGGVLGFPGYMPARANQPSQPGSTGSALAPSGVKPSSGPGASPAAIELPPNALDTWRATFHYGSSGEFFKMVQPVMSGDYPVSRFGKVPVGELPTPLLSRETALPVAESEVRIVGFHLQERAEAPPYIVPRTCRAKVLEMKRDPAELDQFAVEGEDLLNITTGVVSDSQDRVLGILLRGVSAIEYRASNTHARPKCLVTTVSSLRSGIAPVLQQGTFGSTVYVPAWSSDGVSLDFDIWVWDQLARAAEMALLVKRHLGPLPAATQIDLDHWAPILPDMTVVPLAAVPADPQAGPPRIGRGHLAAKWQDPQGVDGRHMLRYAAQLQWTDVGGKVRQSEPIVLIPRLCDRAEWPKMQPMLNSPTWRQAAPLPDGTICLTPESTRGWPGATPFVTDLGTAGPKAISPGTKLEASIVNVGEYDCQFYYNDKERFFYPPVWSSDGSAFFVLTSDGLLRKVAKSDFRVLRSMRLTEPQGTEPGTRPAKTRIFPSSEGLVAVVTDEYPPKFWVLDEETLAVKRGFAIRGRCPITSLKLPIIYVPSYNGLTIVDLRSGEVLRHLGEREKLQEFVDTGKGPEDGGPSMRITLDGRYMACPSSSRREEDVRGVYRIEQDQLIFDPKVAAAGSPVDASREVMLGTALGRLVASAAREAQLRVPDASLFGHTGLHVAISPNGKEIAITVTEGAIVYSPRLPDVAAASEFPGVITPPLLNPKNPE